jgi:hypothetical protein
MRTQGPRLVAERFSASNFVIASLSLVNLMTRLISSFYGIFKIVFIVQYFVYAVAAKIVIDLAHGLINLEIA